MYGHCWQEWHSLPGPADWFIFGDFMGEIYCMSDFTQLNGKLTMYQIFTEIMVMLIIQSDS